MPTRVNLVPCRKNAQNDSQPDRAKLKMYRSLCAANAALIRSVIIGQSEYPWPDSPVYGIQKTHDRPGSPWSRPKGRAGGSTEQPRRRRNGAARARAREREEEPKTTGPVETRSREKVAWPLSSFSEPWQPASNLQPQPFLMPPVLTRQRGLAKMATHPNRRRQYIWQRQRPR
jgi:hypothetical protein